MTWFGRWFGATGGGNSSPALGLATTPDLIRDRIIAVITALTPHTVAGDRFRPYRNEGGGDFQAWAEANAVGCRRRFQVRRYGVSEPPDVSNEDFEERNVTFRILVAYPQTHRDGAGAALDRDDAMDADMFQIDHAIGMCGRANLSPPYPDACWQPSANGVTSEITDPIDGRGVDFVQIFVSYSYRRSVS